MRSFFDKEQFEAPYKSEKGTLSCVSCGLYKFVMTPKMEPYGNFKKGIMVIGEGPGEDEDRKGQPWQGKMGRVLQRKYRQLGIDLFEDCVSLNAVNCRPVDKKGNNRAPTDHEIACCRRKVLTVVKQYKPKVIILQGASAVSSLILGHKWKGKNPSGINAWRGWTIPDREFNAWICPTFHPSFIERQEEQNEAEVLWTDDLKRAISKLDEPFPNNKNEKDCVVISYDVNEVLRYLYNHIPLYLAFDIECTGLKPYNKETHKIVTISFCCEDNTAYAIPFPSDEQNLILLKKLLRHPKIGKIAANMKHEDNWLVSLHGIETKPWVFDTMQAAHVLDNRPGITGLKFQSYVRFGLPEYDGDVSSYLKSEESNIPNRIMELVNDKESFDKLLLYNGIDSLMTYKLAMLQMKELNY